MLLEEWANQAHLEQELDLPISVVASADAAIQAKGQIGFIDLFTLPLYETVADAMPELRVFAESCSANRARWQDRADKLAEQASSPPPLEAPSSAAPVDDQDSSETQSATVTSSDESQRQRQAQDERYRTLFPLSLPRSMWSGGGSNSSSNNSTAPGTSTSTTSDASLAIPPLSAYTHSSSSATTTPTSAYGPSTLQHQQQQQQQSQHQQPQSSEERAALSDATVMRAAYIETVARRRLVAPRRFQSPPALSHPQQQHYGTEFQIGSE